MKKTEYILHLINNTVAIARNHSAANRLEEDLQPLKDRMLHKKGLGLDPDETLAASQIAEAKAAIERYNQSVQIELPSDADILAGLAAAESDSPTSL